MVDSNMPRFKKPQKILSDSSEFQAQPSMTVLSPKIHSKPKTHERKAKSLLEAGGYFKHT